MGRAGHRAAADEENARRFRRPTRLRRGRPRAQSCEARRDGHGAPGQGHGEGVGGQRTEAEARGLYSSPKQRARKSPEKKQCTMKG